jgi:hypothetical protein
MLANLNLGELGFQTGQTTPVIRQANTGDASLTDPSLVFRALNGETGLMSVGINRSLGAGFPVPLTSNSSDTNSRDPLYPIITAQKIHGTLAQSGVGLPVATYPQFNLLTYPQINFGYARPGDPFVAKRNWWAFSMDLAGHSRSQTGLANPARQFVLSIYEIPSQLAISAASFMSLGRLASGEDWDATRTNIQGGVFAGKAVVEGAATLSALASRRGMTLSGDAAIGGQSFANNPFTPGVRETYQVTQGEFYPVSQASESGRAAFVPVNRGAEFFDRFAHGAESNTLSPTTWNNYSVGALQCAMRLDITAVTSSTNNTPTRLRFSYLRNGSRQTLTHNLSSGPVTGLSSGYIYACREDQWYNFGTSVVDLAYGKNGVFAFQTGQTGNIRFDNARFGDPLVGTVKDGYYRPSYPWEIKTLPSGQICIALYPQRFASFLTALQADNTSVNNSLVINVDYTTTGLNNPSKYKPVIPCTDLDYGVVIQECSNFTSFTKGFSLVTNLRTFIGDDFNVTPGTPPTGYTPTGTYYPPVSLFAPEKRYGVEIDPYAIKVGGQLGSLAAEDAANAVRPLDSKTVSGFNLPANRITVNLRPIRHPAELPPVTMMNWLVVLEERRTEFVSY